MSQSLKEALLESFPWFTEELGFKFVGGSYEPRSFGNSDLKLQSSDLMVRFVRDRGLVGAYVADPHSPTKWLPIWWSIRDVLEALGPFTLSGDNGSLEQAVELVRQNLPRLKQALGADYGETVQKMEARKTENMRRLGLI